MRAWGRFTSARCSQVAPGAWKTDWASLIFLATNESILDGRDLFAGGTSFAPKYMQGSSWSYGPQGLPAMSMRKAEIALVRDQGGPATSDFVITSNCGNNCKSRCSVKELMSLVSGYKVNRLNWLAETSKFSWESEG